MRADQVVSELDAFNGFYLGDARRLARSGAAILVGRQPGRPRAGDLDAHLTDWPATDDKLLSVQLVDVRGMIVASSNPKFVGLDLSFRRFVTRALAGEVVVSDPFFAHPLAGGVPVVGYAAPASVGAGPVLGAAIILVRASALWNAVRAGDSRTGFGSYAVLCDRFGIRIAHTLRPDLVFRPAAPLDPAEAATLVAEARFGSSTRSMLEQPFRGADLGGMARAAEAPAREPFRFVSSLSHREVVAVARRLNTAGWTLFHLVPVDTLDAPAGKVWSSLGPGALVGALAIVAAWMLGGRIARPVAELARSADGVARGERAHVAVSGDDELTHLSDRFNEMAAAVREARDELETRVHLRTEDLSAANAKLGAQRAELEQKNVEIARADRLKSEFLANMSHELRTPLNSIIGFSELLGEELAPRLSMIEARHLDNIQASGRHLLQLINDILDLSKIEAGHAELHLAPLDPSAALRDAISMIQVAANRKRIEVRTASGPADVLVSADERKLRQILLNLIANAIKFSPFGSTVEVTSVLVGDRVRVLVKDQGPGMSDDVRERLFQPFVQGESPLQKKHQGTGLGLAICRRLVELQGGEIGADSEPGRGATFWFTIPIADHGASSGPGAPGASGARPVRSAAGADRPQATVVVMAASPSAGSVAALLRNRGIRVLVAGGGAEGIALVRCERPDAVLCDLTAPDPRRPRGGSRAEGRSSDRRDSPHRDPRGRDRQRVRPGARGGIRRLRDDSHRLQDAGRMPGWARRLGEAIVRRALVDRTPPGTCGGP
jgi:signal transduction histidine kinase